MSKVNAAKNPANEGDESPRPAHTPLPWTVGDGDDDYADIDILGAGGSLLALVRNADDFPCINDEEFESVSLEAHANAEFIVRAVNAHDALVGVARRFVQIHTEIENMEDHEWAEEKLVDIARAALALAEGNAPERETETRK